MAWDYAAEAAWHEAECARCGCVRSQHEEDGCYGGCGIPCEEFAG